MDFQDFLDVLKIASTNIDAELKEKMIIESFGAWQIVEALKQIVDGKAKSTPFQSYIKSMGLVDTEEKTNNTVIKMEKRKALITAEETLKQFRQGALRKA